VLYRTLAIFYVAHTVLLGKVSAERDELREEVARLRRITTTLALPVTSAATDAHNSAAGKGVTGALRSVSATGKRSAIPARGASASGAASVSAAVSTAAARGAGEKERLQAATNVLVIELNSEVSRLYFCVNRTAGDNRICNT
jgi:hypothetical protein